MLVRHYAILNLNESFSPVKADAVQFYEVKKLEASQSLQVFWDAGRDFNEADSGKYPIKNKKAYAKVMLPAHTRKLRLDPGELRSGLHFRWMSWSDGSPVKFLT